MRRRIAVVAAMALSFAGVVALSSAPNGDGASLVVSVAGSRWSGALSSDLDGSTIDIAGGHDEFMLCVGGDGSVVSINPTVAMLAPRSQADILRERLVRYLLGRSADATNLDINLDGQVDIADLVAVTP